eukprot:CFRG7149T1
MPQSITLLKTNAEVLPRRNSGTIVYICILRNISPLIQHCNTTKISRVAMLNVSLVIILLAVTAAYVSLPELVVNSVPITLSERTYDGVYADYTDLKSMKRLFKGKLSGPETIVIRQSDDFTVALTRNGSVIELDPTSGNVQNWAYAGGRCLGGAFDKNGDLIAAEVSKGLIKIDKNTKEITVLSNIVDGRPIRFADDVSISPVTGNIYFSDATIIVPDVDNRGNIDVLYAAKVECVAGVSTGRLLEYNPKTGNTTVLIDGISFANGVTVSRDGSFVLVNETCGLRTLRFWLSGPKKGTHDIFNDSLIGLPDGIASGVDANGQEVFYIAIFAPLSNIISLTMNYPKIRQMILHLPKWFPVPLPKHGTMLRLNREGEVTHSWHDDSGVIHGVTCAVPYKEGLYIGSLHEDYVGYLPMKEPSL